MSWVGHNIFGKLDGKVLDDPENKQSKVSSKDQLLEKVLGYSRQTLVSIEHIAILRDWRTVWNHVHFRGFFWYTDIPSADLAELRFPARCPLGNRPVILRTGRPRTRRNRCLELSGELL